jgi:hypothetical protein
MDEFMEDFIADLLGEDDNTSFYDIVADDADYLRKKEWQETSKKLIEGDYGYDRDTPEAKEYFRKLHEQERANQKRIEENVKSTLPIEFLTDLGDTSYDDIPF